MSTHAGRPLSLHEYLHPTAFIPNDATRFPSDFSRTRVSLFELALKGVGRLLTGRRTQPPAQRIRPLAMGHGQA